MSTAFQMVFFRPKTKPGVQWVMQAIRQFSGKRLDRKCIWSKFIASGANLKHFRGLLKIVNISILLHKTYTNLHRSIHQHTQTSNCIHLLTHNYYSEGAHTRTYPHRNKHPCTSTYRKHTTTHILALWYTHTHTHARTCIITQTTYTHSHSMY